MYAGKRDESVFDGLFRQVLERNARETEPFLTVHASNSALVSEIEDLQFAYEELERIGHAKDGVAGTLHDGVARSSVADSAALRNELKLREQLEKLQEELADQEAALAVERKEAAQIVEQLDAQKRANVDKDQRTAELQRQNDKMERGIQHLSNKVTDAEARMALAEQQCNGLKDSIRTMQAENVALAKEKDDLEARFLAEKTKMSQDIIQLMDTVDQLKNQVGLLQSFRTEHEERARWIDRARLVHARRHGEIANDTDETSCTAVASAEPSQPKTTIQAHPKEATSVRYDDSGSGLLVTAGSDSVVKVWDASVGTARAVFNVGGSHIITSCDLSNGVVVAGGGDKTCRVWDLTTQRMVHHLVGHAGTVNCVRLFAESQAVVTGSSDRTLRVWDLSGKTYRQTAMFRYSASPSCVDVGQDWLTAVSGHADGHLHVWDTFEGESIGSMPRLHGSGIASVQFHPVAKTHVLTNGLDHTLRLVDIRTSTTLRVFEHSQLRTSYSRSSASFSPDGKYICCGTSQGRLMVWATDDGSIRTVCYGHTDGIRGVSWGVACATKDDGDSVAAGRVASIDKAGVLLLW